MKKTFILDATVFETSPFAMFAFDDNDVIIPTSTVDALNKTANTPNWTKAQNADKALRLISGIMGKMDTETLSVTLPSGGTIKIIDSTDGMDSDLIKKAIFISNDVSVRLRFLANGFETQPFWSDSVPGEFKYTGYREVYFTSGFDMSSFQSNGAKINDIEIYQDDDSVNAMRAASPDDFYANEFLILHSGVGNGTMLGRVRKVGNSTRIVPLQYVSNSVYGVNPKNVAQRFALEALMLPLDECSLVFLKGPAGTAKTFLALAAGLQQVIGGDDEKYAQILISRPNEKMDKTIGFLKGTEAEKISPLLRPVMDNLQQLTRLKYENDEYDNKGVFSTRKCKSQSAEKTNEFGAPNDYIQDLFMFGKLTAQSMEYMRGRSVPDTYMLIDEAQNMSPLQAKSIITRCGIGTKIVLTGDPEQVDNESLNANNNGLSVAAYKMLGDERTAQITFGKEDCVRSYTANSAIQRMMQKGEHMAELLGFA